MNTDLRVASTKFWKWFDAKEKEAKASEVGKVMTAAHYQVWHSGGGCLAWMQVLEADAYLLICDVGNGLGARPDEPYLVGLHMDEDCEGDEVPNLAAAVEWCSKAAAALAICRKWVAKIGGGFHPDTAGFRYEPKLSAQECEEYEQDIQQLFRNAPGDPYKFAIMALREVQ